MFLRNTGNHLSDIWNHTPQQESANFLCNKYLQLNEYMEIILYPLQGKTSLQGRNNVTYPGECIVQVPAVSS
jgi:hypothetical protein